MKAQKNVLRTSGTIVHCESTVAVRTDSTIPPVRKQRFWCSVQEVNFFPAIPTVFVGSLTR